MHVRAMRTEDAALVEQMYEKLSDDSMYLRFFSPVTANLASALEMNHVGEPGNTARVALLGGEIVAAARFDVVRPGVAEVAFVVADEHQGRGVGTLLLEHLAVIARLRGVHTFAAQTLACNPAMLQVFAAAGWDRKVRVDAGTVHTEFSIDPTPASLRAIEHREHHAEAASVARLLAPHSSSRCTRS